MLYDSQNGNPGALARWSPPSVQPGRSSILDDELDVVQTCTRQAALQVSGSLLCMTFLLCAGGEMSALLGRRLYSVPLAVRKRWTSRLFSG